MHKNGFIATSLIYSFFLIFLAIIANILFSYAHNRILLNNINEGILDDLNESISNKYIILENHLKNGNMETDDSWLLNNAVYSNFSSFSGNRSIQLNKDNSSISQPLSKNIIKGHKYYISFRLFRNGLISGNNSVTLTGNTTYNFNINYVNNGFFSNWVLYSGFIEINQNVTQTYNFNIINNTTGSYSNLHIDDIMLLDITAIKDDYPESTLKTYLDNLDFIITQKSVPKP